MNADINHYMNQVTKIPLLSKEEQSELLEKYHKTKDPQLKNKIVEHNLRLVVKIAFQFKGVSIRDLIQEGNVGLMRAVDKFNPEKGVSFGYYSVFWIKAFMYKYVLNNIRPVKCMTTSANRKLLFNMAKTKAKFRAQGIELSNEDLAKKLEVNVEDIERFEKLFVPFKRISSPKYPEDSNAYEYDTGIYFPEQFDADYEGRTPSKLLEKSELKNKLNKAMDEFSRKLKPKHRVIFERRFLKYDPDTFESIGRDLPGPTGKPLSRQRVQQIESDLRARLQKFLKFKEITP